MVFHTFELIFAGIVIACFVTIIILGIYWVLWFPQAKKRKRLTSYQITNKSDNLAFWCIACAVVGGILLTVCLVMANDANERREMSRDLQLNPKIDRVVSTSSEDDAHVVFKKTPDKICWVDLRRTESGFWVIKPGDRLCEPSPIATEDPDYIKEYLENNKSNE